MRTVNIQTMLAVMIAQVAACGSSSETDATHPGHPYTEDGGGQSVDGSDATDGGNLLPDSALADEPKSDAAQVDAADAPEPSCPGIQAWTSGKCVCPANMEPKGAACVETFENTAVPAQDWVWEPPACALTFSPSCKSSNKGADCDGAGTCGTVPCSGDVGWKVAESPFSGGGQAIQVYDFANNNNCCYGGTLTREYVLGKSTNTKDFKLSIDVAAEGGGATWQCGSIRIELQRLDSEHAVPSATYSDGVYGSYMNCGEGGALIVGNKATVDFDLYKTIDKGKGVPTSFDRLRIQLYKYACAYDWHKLTIDNVTMQ
jgi:hypothetical protein